MENQRTSVISEFCITNDEEITFFPVRFNISDRFFCSDEDIDDIFQINESSIIFLNIGYERYSKENLLEGVDDCSYLGLNTCSIHSIFSFDLRQ